MIASEKKKSKKSPIIRVFNASSTLPEGFARQKPVKEETFKQEIKKIIDEVKTRGDDALIKFTKEFDGASIKAQELKVAHSEIEKAYRMVNEELIIALKSMKEKVETLEKLVLERIKLTLEIDGAKVQVKPCPIESVGCYVPGGKAAYPSTLIMTAAPAKLAGVPRVIVCSPPDRNASLNPSTLVAADLCKVDELYKVGGAQSIAAMAYGTETIKPVKKIVGPGSKYVTMAKLLVSEDVAIDSIAGPSELLVLADETANPFLVALDMCSQAEHGPDSIVGLLTTSEELAEKILSQLEKILISANRSEMIAESLRNHGFIVVCDNVDKMVELANLFAPEHVEILTENCEEVADKVVNAGLILTGNYSPVALCDYYVGTNHVLPTGGFARIRSGLSILDFVRRIAIVKCSREGLAKTRKPIKILAEAENLPNHYKAVEGRFKVENQR